MASVKIDNECCAHVSDRGERALIDVLITRLSARRPKVRQELLR